MKPRVREMETERYLHPVDQSSIACITEEGARLKESGIPCGSLT